MPVSSRRTNASGRMTSSIHRRAGLGDGGLALFNGGTMGDPAALEVTVKRSGVRGKPNLSAPRSEVGSALYKL